jgi:hypothetical protein
LKLSSACGDQPALLHHRLHRDIRAFVEESAAGKASTAVVLGDVQHAVRREAQPVRHAEADGGREDLHLVRHAVAVAVGDRPDAVLAGADEDHAGSAHRHVPRVRHHGVELDAEALRQLDALQVAAQRVGAAAVLRHRFHLHGGARRAELLQTVEIAALRGGRGAGRRRPYRRRGLAGGSPARRHGRRLDRPLVLPRLRLRHEPRRAGRQE